MDTASAGTKDAIGSQIIIRFDGLDAERHEIELSALATSLSGISRIVGVSANFAATQKLNLHQDALSVRVYATPPEAHCFELFVWVKWAAEQPLISATVAGLTVVLVTYVFKRAAGQKEEMRQLRGALDEAIKQLGTRDQPIVDRLLETIDKMADALRPAARKAVAPIGETAATLTIGSVDGAQKAVVGQAEKEAITSASPVEVDVERGYLIRITELDMDTGSCKVAMDAEPDARYAARITDPAFSAPNNRYVMAMAAKSTLNVRAKATLKDGEIDRLFISDAAP
ncbi:hypothetical protein V5F32_05040 [Xanthobacter oligotrophicus]|uniref:HAMP domain-containing protein n=1 Tax=Xanthobacter oligotrophicus TaxID=2607286 RepID=A0ABW6ZUY0_9HYPH